ncbi:OmpA family protein [Pseudokineococcus marinus]
MGAALPALLVLSLSGCGLLGGDDPEPAGGAPAPGGSEVEVSEPEGSTPRSSVTTAPADPGSEVSVVDELPETTLVDGASVGDTSVEVRVAELLGSLDTREAQGGETVVVLAEQILFDFDAAELRPGSEATLQQVVELLSLSDDPDVAVVGHTDGRGTPEYNQDLSERRAQAVVAALVELGADPARLQPEGRGQTQPVAQETTADGADDPEGRAANRRVEVLVDDLPGQD